MAPKIKYKSNLVAAYHSSCGWYTAAPSPWCAETSECRLPTSMKLLDGMPLIQSCFFNINFVIGCPSPYRDPVDGWSHCPIRPSCTLNCPPPLPHTPDQWPLVSKRHYFLLRFDVSILCCYYSYHTAQYFYFARQVPF